MQAPSRTEPLGPMMAVSRPGAAPPEMPFSSSRFWLRVGEGAQRWGGGRRAEWHTACRLELRVAFMPLQLAHADCAGLPSSTAPASASPPISSPWQHQSFAAAAAYSSSQAVCITWPTHSAASPRLLVGQRAGEVAPLQLHLVGASSQHAASAAGGAPHPALLPQPGQPLQASQGTGVVPAGFLRWQSCVVLGLNRS